MHLLKLSTRQVAVCAVFAAAAFAVRAAQLVIPISGPYVLDTRDIFVAVGSAYSGPIGGIIIGALSGVPAKYPICDMPSFALAGFLVGLLVPRLGWIGGFGVLAGYPLAAAIITAIGLIPSFTLSFTYLLPRMLVAVPVEIVILFAVLKRFPIKGET